MLLLDSGNSVEGRQQSEKLYILDLLSSAAAIFFLLLPPLSINRTSVAASTCVKFISVLVSYLSARLPAAVLSALLKTSIKIGSDDTFVELGASNIFHAVECLLMRVVFDKAKSAGSLLETVQAHDKTFDLAAFREQLMDLFFRGVE